MTPDAGQPPAPSPSAPQFLRRFDWSRPVALGALITFMALCEIGLLIYVGSHIGAAALGIGFVTALIPVPVLVASFLWLDRYEPEPVRYLLFCFAWGATVAAGFALLINTEVARAFKRAGISESVVAVITAPATEETLKALGPILLFVVFRRRAFSGLVDGIVYCGLSATGFAMTENVLYLGGYGYAANADKGGVAAGVAGVIGIFIARILFSGFAHPLFTALTGIGLGVAARTPDRRVKVLAPLAGLLAAMILHGSWNLMSTLAVDRNNYYMLYGYFSVMVPIFLGMVGLALWLRSSEGLLTQRVLPAYVRAGWFTPPELASLATIGRRQSARAWAGRVGGKAAAAAMRGFQFAATQLALLRDSIDRGVVADSADAARAVAEEKRLLEAISGYRSVFTGRDPMTPPARWDGARYYLTFPDGMVRVVPQPAEPVAPVPVFLAPPAPWGAPPGYPGPAPIGR